MLSVIDWKLTLVDGPVHSRLVMHAGDNALLRSSSLTALQNQSGATAAELIMADTWEGWRGRGGGRPSLPSSHAVGGRG